MEAAEKIPKKLYVYLDTTRGLCHRYGCPDVPGGGAGDRLRHHRKCPLRRDLDALPHGVGHGESSIKKECRQTAGTPFAFASVHPQIGDLIGVEDMQLHAGSGGFGVACLNEPDDFPVILQGVGNAIFKVGDVRVDGLADNGH